jgi:hypothetical protein
MSIVFERSSDLSRTSRLDVHWLHCPLRFCRGRVNEFNAHLRLPWLMLRAVSTPKYRWCAQRCRYSRYRSRQGLSQCTRGYTYSETRLYGKQASVNSWGNGVPQFHPFTVPEARTHMRTIILQGYVHHKIRSAATFDRLGATTSWQSLPPSTNMCLSAARYRHSDPDSLMHSDSAGGPFRTTSHRISPHLLGPRI